MKNKEKEIEDIYFFKIRKIRYLRSINYKTGCCQVCGKKRETTAHHLIPKRLRCTCPFLSEVRIRVCSGCNSKFHPENKLIKESDIISKLSQYILNLQKTICQKDNIIRELTKGLRNMVKDITMLLDFKDNINKYKNKIQKEVKKNNG